MGIAGVYELARDDIQAEFTDGDVSGRGAVYYLIRNTQQHYVQLSVQADLKCNIVIAASSILLTASLAALDEPTLRTSAVILAAGCATALTLAVLAVLPVTTARKRAGKVNPLFHIDAAALDLSEYRDRMRQICATDDEVFEAQLDDLHEFAVFLSTSKYRRLRRAYLAFVIAMVVAATHQLVAELL